MGMLIAMTLQVMLRHRRTSRLRRITLRGSAIDRLRKTRESFVTVHRERNCCFSLFGQNACSGDRNSLFRAVRETACNTLESRHKFMQQNAKNDRKFMKFPVILPALRESVD
jgi:hypothetical protein